MHATAEQLLACLDNSTECNEARTHISACEICQAELFRLKTLKRDLQNLPAFEPPRGVWQKVIASHAAGEARSRQAGKSAWYGIGIGLAASVVLAVVIFSLQFQKPAPELRENESELAVLVKKSKHLESYLSYVDARSSVVSARTADTITRLEDGIALIDYQLNNAARTRLSRRQEIDLWRQRNELMQSLLTVKYAQAKANSI
ncbi:MAG: hypothetical protein MJA83_13060 [Gammaproteobacteria bacterium]|nr:hypothetical protein [Gammaproteobacteria bacterium]